MKLFRRRKTATTPTPPSEAAPPSGATAPTAPTGSGTPDGDRMVSLVKTAAVSLEKAGLAGQRAAVYLLLDHSGSMQSFYRNGSVQRLAEQALGLSANLDDDGSVPVTYFHGVAEPPFTVEIGRHEGVIAATHPKIRWGTTNYAAAMKSVIAQHRQAATSDPAFVIFQTDGAPNSRREAEKALREASSLPVFWAFVGFGNRIAFLEKLDDLTGRKVDNASFFHARDPRTVTDAALYDGLTKEFASWLAASRAAGIR
jgi:vWA found in TerF C terminus